MLKETHLKIAGKISQELNLPPKAAKLLALGSVSPDSWQDFPHHHGKEKEIVENILKVHQLYVEGDDECYHKLGVALHYIQDKWTLKPRIATAHTEWERLINISSFMNDSELEKAINESTFPTKVQLAYIDFLRELELGVEGMTQPLEAAQTILNQQLGSSYHPYAMIKYYQECGLKVVLFALQKRPSTWSSPEIDFNVAYRASLEIAKRVLSNGDGSDSELWYDHEKQKADEKKESEQFRLKVKKDLEASEDETLAIVAFVAIIGAILVLLMS